MDKSKKSVKSNQSQSTSTSIQGKNSVKTKSKMTQLVDISRLKPNILAKNKNNYRKQSFDQQMYGREEETSDLIQELNICNICDQKFDSKSLLCDHLKNSHNLIEPIKELPFPDLIECEAKSSGRIQCGKCLFRTDSEAELILHSVNHSFVSSDSKSFKMRCPACDHLFTKTVLQTHVFIHTSEKPFKCEICEKEYRSRQSLLTHKKRHSSKDLKCQTCGISFTDRRSHRNHMKTHSGEREKNFSCELCGAAFFDKESMKAHTIRLHQPKTVRRFKCEFSRCRYMTLYHHQLLEHQRTHSDDKPFACDQCEYTAKSKWSFRKHYRRHTKEKPFKCQICDYSSSLCSNLTRHMRIHTGSKPFKCPYCEYSCNNHENLRKHVLKSKKHEGLPLYKCKHCMFATNSFSELRQHLEDSHSDIYSVEEIDKMISSFYHKSEDNTTIVCITELVSEETPIDDNTQSKSVISQDSNQSNSSDN